MMKVSESVQRSWAEIVVTSKMLGCGKCGSKEQHVQQVGSSMLLLCDKCKAVIVSRPLTKRGKL